MTQIETLCSIFEEVSSMKYKVGENQSEGVFATKDIVIGEMIDLVSENSTKSPLGLYVNYKTSGNTKAIKLNDNYYLMAIKFINSGDEIFASSGEQDQEDEIIL